MVTRLIVNRIKVLALKKFFTKTLLTNLRAFTIMQGLFDTTDGGIAQLVEQTAHIR